MAIFEAFTLICFRVHYTGDIVAGVIIGYWIYDICDYLKDPVDKAIFFDKEEDEEPLI